MTDTFNTRWHATGKLQRLTEDQIRIFADQLEVVPDDAKPFDPEVVGTLDEDTPITESVLAAQQVYNQILEDNAPNSKVARAAKADLDEAIQQAKSDQAAADEVNARILSETRPAPAAGANNVDPAELAVGAPHDEEGDR